MEFFTHKIGNGKNDITDMSELILDAEGVKGFQPKADPSLAEIHL